MQAKELRDLSDQELSVKELELKEALFRLRLRRETSQVENPAALTQTRRDIARIKTIQGERVRAGRVG